MIKRIISFLKPSPLAGLSKNIDLVIKEMDRHGDITTLKSLVFAKSLHELFMRQDFCLNIVLSPSGKFVLVNPYFTEALGWKLSDINNKLFLDLVHPDDKVKTLDFWKKYINETTEIPKFENRYLRKNGGYAVVKWQAIPPTKDGFFFTSALVEIL